VRCGIKGVMRRVVLDAARTMRIRAVERDVLPAELAAADEIFVTNALFGIWPVTELDGRRLSVGTTTERLMAHLGYADA
jgi:branched-subunit amino acid aminotransferase/4-amino-4-deoxychorismate lyase